jgi:hypothetical protein
VSRFSLVALLGLAFVLRAGLALQGGQFYFADESRILRGVLLYRSVLHGQWDLAAQAISTSQHAAFPFVGALIAAPAHLCALLAGTGDWSQAAQVRAAAPFLATFLALFSVANVWLLHRLVLRHGGTKPEADLAALLAAVSGSLVFYARHLLPYDCALTAALAGLVVAATARTTLHYLLAGACAGACVALYNGYWFLAPLITVALIARPQTWSERSRAAFLSGVGGALALAALTIPAILATGPTFWSDLATFSGTVTQGLFSEGWSLPFEYLWQVEGVFGAGLALLLVFTLVRWGVPLPPRIRHWLILAATIYALLVLGSTALEKFVVYGRSVRPLTFLLCALGGWALTPVFTTFPRWRITVVGMLLALAALNFRPHLGLTFPQDVRLTVWSAYGVPKLTSSFSGIMRDPFWPTVTRPDLTLVNALALYPLRAPVPAPAGNLLAEWRHPCSVRAYQYEGHTPRERALLRNYPSSIQLLALTTPSAVPDEPPLEFYVRKSELPDGRDHSR